MPPADVNRLEIGHVDEPNDCAITALSAYLGIDYTDVIRIAARVTQDGGKHGLALHSIRKIAALCGTTLTVRRVFAPEDAYGIVMVTWKGHHEGHAAMLREGHVADRNMLWDWADWHAHMGNLVKKRDGTPRAMLTRLLCAVE